MSSEDHALVSVITSFGGHWQNRQKALFFLKTVVLNLTV